MNYELDRYRRQIALPMIGAEGQQRLHSAHALIVGCGALGSVIVDQLARAGVGTLTIVDRDVVERSNLQRQTLFDELDAERATPKVEAAKARVARINSEVRVRAFFDDLGSRNAERYAEGAQVIVDGLDNLETRYLLNDLAVKRGVPYVYGGAVGTCGMGCVVIPGATPCLRCIAPEPPPAGAIETCDTAGILASAAAIVASFEATNVIKLLVGALDAVDRGLVSFDLWTNVFRRIETSAARDPECVCCGQRRYEFLDGTRMQRVTALCGKNAVQIAPREAMDCDLDAIAARLAPHARVERGSGVVHASFIGEALGLDVFADGRVVVRGTTEPERARSLVAQYVGV